MPVDVRAIELIRSALEKEYKSSTEIFPDFCTYKVIDVIKTSSSILNAITVVGGIPRDRVTEIFGPNSTGKTTIALETAIAAQKESPNQAVLYVDFEHALDVAYAHKLGLDLDPNRFVVAQPDHFEQGEEIIHQFLMTKEGQPRNLFSLVVIDSQAAMIPKAELEGTADDKLRIGLQAQLQSRFYSRATKWISKGIKPALLVLNQTRTHIDVNNPRNTGEDAAGGRALKFYSTIRLKLETTQGEGETMRQKKLVGSDQVYTRTRTRVTAVKNKVAAPWVRGQLVFEFGTGINNTVSVAELAENKLGIMSGAGFFNYKGATPETSVQCRGREEFARHLEINKPLREELEQQVLLAIRAEHAKMLGLTEIKKGAAAKELEDMVLEETTEQNGGIILEELQ